MHNLARDQKRLYLLFSLLLGVAIGICSMVAVTINFLDVQEITYEGKLDEKDAEIAQLNSQITFLNAEIDQINMDHETVVDEYQTTIDSLNADYNQLQTAYEEFAFETQIEGESTFDTLAKYWYVFEDADPDCGLTVGMIQLADNLCKEYDLNPDIIWTIIKLESNYQPDAQNSRSSARGLGQILSSTARTVYEDFMGNGTGSYTHEMAYNGYTNLEMMITYVAYLRDTCGSLKAMINAYSGDSSGGYYSTFAKYMQSFGHSLSDTSYAGQKTIT